MQTTGSPFSPENWMRDIFASKSVARGHVIRRKQRDIERYVGMERFLAELQDRGFQAVENRGHVVIFCNAAPIRRLA